MSAATKSALEEAIASHFADEQEGAIVTGYVLQVEGQGFLAGDDEVTRLSREVPAGQSLPLTLGLIDIARVRLHASAATD